MRLLPIAAAATVFSILAGTAAAGGGSPFNGHYVGKSADGRHHVDLNVDGGAVRTTSLKLACPGRPGYGDFAYRVVIAGSGRFSASVAGAGSGRPVRLGITAQVGGGFVRGRLTARVGSCTAGPVQFTLRRVRA